MLLIEEIKKESDRGCILICSSLLDGLLEEVLSNYLLLQGKKESVVKDLFSHSTAPLYTFAAKIKFAYLFSVIEDWMFEDLNLIRKIRNDCAHEFSSVGFDDENIVKKTEYLQGADYWISIFDDKSKVPALSSKKEKNRFVFSVLYIHSHLARATEFERLKNKLMQIKNEIIERHFKSESVK
jgi:DNA-binding MltR family transcriptional regulator